MKHGLQERIHITSVALVQKPYVIFTIRTIVSVFVIRQSYVTDYSPAEVDVAQGYKVLEA